MCGTAPWEWDPEQGGSRFAYDAVERYCQGCAAKAALRDNDPGRNTDGITIELARNDNSRETAKRRMRQARMAQGG